VVCQSEANRSHGTTNAKGKGKGKIAIEIETEGTTRTRMEGQKRPETTDAMVKEQASRARCGFARRNDKFCQGKQISSSIGIGETESIYRTRQGLKGLMRRQYKSNIYCTGQQESSMVKTARKDSN
jgi:hypothetical protein